MVQSKARVLMHKQRDANMRKFSLVVSKLSRWWIKLTVTMYLKKKKVTGIWHFGNWQIHKEWKQGHLEMSGVLTAFHLCCHLSRRRQWHPTPVLLPGESQGRGSLVGCHLWGRTESDTTERLSSSSSSHLSRISLSRQNSTLLKPIVSIYLNTSKQFDCSAAGSHTRTKPPLLAPLQETINWQMFW